MKIGVRIKLLVAAILLSIKVVHSQDKIEFSFLSDTMTFFQNKKVLEGEYIETTLKKLSVVRIFKTQDEHFFIRLIVTENFYFDKIDVLEVRSGNKSYYVKNCKQYKIDKTKGLYEFEVFKNYLAQLKDDGITSLYFAGRETDFTRQDANQLKKMFKYFFEQTFAKK
jgi:hypothetical protein